MAEEAEVALSRIELNILRMVAGLPETGPEPTIPGAALWASLGPLTSAGFLRTHMSEEGTLVYDITDKGRLEIRLAEEAAAMD